MNTRLSAAEKAHAIRLYRELPRTPDGRVVKFGLRELERHLGIKRASLFVWLKQEAVSTGAGIQ